ncbi:MAG: DUF3857 domain-containing protein [Bacteroidales bacterium]|nr:DUF3857 domain-containing protein [Lentimicrobiaceae bacterium]MDD5694461.1 DUF3857 domain-containing protein [Bacteroidales bacterium]
MRKLIVSALLAGCGSLLCTHLLAQEPETDAEYTRIVKEYRLNADGSMENRVIKELRILTHFAFHSLYGETFVVYDPRYQKLQINEAYTVMADGKKVMTPENAFNEVLPRFAANFPDALHLREMVITHTGLEVGAVIYLDYTITTASGYYPALMAKEVLVASSPVRNQVITVDIPDSVELYHKMLHLRTAPEVYRENGRKRFIWTFSPLKARAQEPFLPSDTKYLPTLIFSAGHNFDEAFAAFLSQEAFHWNVNREMEERLVDIKHGQSDPFCRVLAIQKLVVEEFNLFDVPLEYTGYRVRTAEETWLSNGGTEAEKNVLLCALLKEAGYAASLSAILPNELMDRSIGCLPAMKGFAVEVTDEEWGSVLLSGVRTDDQGMRTALLGNSLVQLNPVASYLEIKTVPPQAGILDAEFHLMIDTAIRLSGSISANLEKIYNPWMAMKRDTDYVKGVWTSFASSGFIKSTTVKASGPEQSLLLWETECPRAFKEQDEYCFLELPVFKNGFNGFPMNFLNASRKAPLEIPFPLQESYSYSLELPATLHLITESENSVMVNPVGTVTVKIAAKKQTVSVFRELKLTMQEISLQHYEELRALINEWNDINKRRLIFKKEK